MTGPENDEKNVSIYLSFSLLFKFWMQLTFCSDQQFLDFPSLHPPFCLTQCSAVPVIQGGKERQKGDEYTAQVTMMNAP